MKKYTQLRILFSAMSALVLGSCVSDPFHEPPGPVVDSIRELRLTVDIPADRQGGATRAITATEENTIQSVNVLAFRIDAAGETYDYQTTATLAPNNVPGSTTQTFIANLRMQTYQQRFVVITNAASLVAAQTGAVAPGMAKARVLSFLEYDFAANQDRWAAGSTNNYAAIPMWGESAAETITPTTRQLSATIPLLRMLARVDVRLDPATVTTGRFKLRSVNIYNVNNGGRIVPDAANIMSSIEPSGPYVRATAPTIPTSLRPYSSRTLGPVTYTDFTAPGVTDVSMVGAIYLFETAAATTAAEATCVVVGGLYDTDTSPTYYRVELFAAGTQNRLDIIRNYRYIVNINDVRGRGYPTAQQAFNSPPVNMTAQVLRWSRPGMDNIVFNNTNWLANDKETVNLWSNEYTTALASDENVTLVSTDVPGGWTLGPITNEDGTGTANWVRIAPISGGTGVSDVTRVTISVDANLGTAPRTAILNLDAGRLRLPIRIVQSNRPAISLSVVDSNNQELTELVFSSPAGVTPASRQFVVNWLPAGNPVNVNPVTQVGQYEFPNPGGNPAVQDGAPWLYMPWPERTGARIFTVAPPALTAAELSANPFIEKSSRFEFTVYNGFTQITRNITLRQLWYNLRVEPEPFPQPYFPMDGNRYSYNVRSNTTWRIRSVVETPRVAGTRLIAASTGVDNVYAGATGGPVMTPGGGWRESLTTNNQARGMSGWADVTYESDKDPAQFQPVTRRLYFPAASMNIYGIAATAGGDPTPFNMYAGNTNSGNMQAMVTAPVNYGTNVNGTNGTPTGTVFVRNVNISGYNSNSGTAITRTQIDAATSAGADMLVISGPTTFDQTTGNEIFNQFLNRNKPVFLCMEDITSINFVLAACGIGNYQWTTNPVNGNAPVYWLNSWGAGSEPIITDGPFGNQNGSYIGFDGNANPVYYFGGQSGVRVYANAVNRSGDTTNVNGQDANNGATFFRLMNYPLVVVLDNGFMVTADPNSQTSSPSILYGALQPNSKPNYGGGTTKQTSANARVTANIVAWAIQRRTTQ